MTHFKAALMYISLRKKNLHYYPSSIITHKNLSTTPFITCNTCYNFSCYRQWNKSSKYAKIVVLEILIQHFGDIGAFIRHNFMIFVISKCKIKGILMLKLMFSANFRLRKF